MRTTLTPLRRALRAVLHLRIPLLRPAPTPRPTPSVHLTASVRPEGSAWAVLGSDGTALTGTGSEGDDELVLELRALLGALDALPGAQLVWNATTLPVVGLVDDSTRRYLERAARRREAVRFLARELSSRPDLPARLVVVPPGTPCPGCDQGVLRSGARRLLRRSAPVPIPRTVVATDGSVNPEAGIGAWAWWVSPTRWECGTMETSSSGLAELAALASALEAFDPDSPVLVVSDSRNVVDACERFLSSGRLPRCSGPSAPEARALWARVVPLLSTRSVSFEWVAAHRGHPANTEADVRARAAMRARVRSLDPEPACAS